MSGDRVRCKTSTSTQSLGISWNDAGSEDSAVFTLSSLASTTTASGIAAVTFAADPDYETPGDSNTDNEYLVRVVNNNDLLDVDVEEVQGPDAPALPWTSRLRYLTWASQRR